MMTRRSHPVTSSPLLPLTLSPCHVLHPYERQAQLAVRYKDIVVGEFRADFLVEGKVVVELKAIKALTAVEEAQLLNYLKGTGYRNGLLLNFGTTSLEHKRRIM